jgi:hypothetical protein
MTFARGSLAALLAVAGCGPINTGHETSSTDDQAPTLTAAHDTRFAPESQSIAGLHCASPVALPTDATRLADQHTPVTGESSSPCGASDAPQRFYAITLPAHSRATVYAVPSSSSCPWPIVMRAVSACDASACMAESRSIVDGEPVALLVDNDDDVEVVRVVSVSGTSASEGGAFDIAAGVEAR